MTIEIKLANGVCVSSDGVIIDAKSGLWGESPEDFYRVLNMLRPACEELFKYEYMQDWMRAGGGIDDDDIKTIRRLDAGIHYSVASGRIIDLWASLASACDNPFMSDEDKRIAEIAYRRLLSAVEKNRIKPRKQ